MSVTNIVDLAYIRVGSSDLEASQRFLERFGFRVQKAGDPDNTVLYSRGTGSSPYLHVTECGGAGLRAIAFEVESREALEALAQQPGASQIEKIAAVSGGEKVCFTDPNGYCIEAIFGWEKVAEIAPETRPPINTGDTRARLREPVRFARRPSQVKRLGHVVLGVKNLAESEAWYKNLFGFLASDQIFDGEKDNVVGAFLRCNRGAIPVDHHTIALVVLPDPSMIGVQHVAFEVHDWDDLMLGHDVLKESGYKHYWGVGKHILGSQIFDYWVDPDGLRMEHFTDGDLFDADEPVRLSSKEDLHSAQWGGGQRG